MGAFAGTYVIAEQVTLGGEVWVLRYHYESMELQVLTLKVNMLFIIPTCPKV